MSAVIACRFDEAVLRPGRRGTVRAFLGDPHAVDAGSGDGPQVFAVDVDPRFHEPAHFHDVDQFQVFLAEDGGDAYFQRRPVGPLTLQYADAFTTYGPFGTGSSRLRFYTLRPRPSSLRGYLPGDRDKLVRRPTRRNHRIALGPRLDAPVPDSGAATWQDLLPPAPDGLAASWIDLPSQASATLPPVRGAGGFDVVVRGAAVFGERPVDRGGLVWAPPVPEPDASRVVTGGPDGASVLTLRFPLTHSVTIPMLHDHIVRGPEQFSPAARDEEVSLRGSDDG